jgi:beta-mannosidase
MLTWPGLRLEDPFVGFNELKAAWVSTRSWTYKRIFYAPLIGHRSKVILALDGLDTFAYVRLNGKLILKSDNMFISHRVDVTEFVTSQGRCEIDIKFDPALFQAREIQKDYPHHKWLCWNGESARLAVRKAQYHWGWDWGPKLMGAGIWKPIRLEVYAAKIEEVRTDITLASDRGAAIINVSAKIATDEADRLDLHVTVEISIASETVSTSVCDVSVEGRASTDLHVPSPLLWMPAGYGAQDLYNVQVELFSGDTKIHSASRRIGMRTVELVQLPDKYGRSFYFRINGIDIFCGGSCWIPADIFLPKLTTEKYRACLEPMVAANQKMIR